MSATLNCTTDNGTVRFIPPERDARRLQTSLRMLET